MQAKSFTQIYNSMTNSLYPNVVYLFLASCYSEVAFKNWKNTYWQAIKLELSYEWLPFVLFGVPFGINFIYTYFKDNGLQVIAMAFAYLK